MNFKDFKAIHDSDLLNEIKALAEWGDPSYKPFSSFLLLANQSIVPSWQFVVQTSAPFFAARIYCLDTPGGAREYCLSRGGVMIAGQNTCIVFEGAADRDLLAVSLNTREDIRQFMDGAAVWLQAKTK